MAQICVSGSENSTLKRIGNYHPIFGPMISYSRSRASSYVQRAEKLIGEIKEMFEAILMGDGQITPYDTAWVARVPAIDGSLHPQFPATLQWLLQNQLNDGSWGLQSHFLIFDRLLNTLSSILTLTAWKTGNAHIRQEEAKQLGLSLPYDLPCFNSLSMYRQEKLTSISTDTIHSAPTSLLYSLEGVQDMINWNKILELQCKDGSFLGSPSSTTYVLMHTRDDKCLGFLTRIMSKFGNCVPCLYPIDLLQCLLMVDNVECLGIDRHFQKEIKVVLHYVYRMVGYKKGSWPMLMKGREEAIIGSSTKNKLKCFSYKKLGNFAKECCKKPIDAKAEEKKPYANIISNSDKNKLFVIALSLNVNNPDIWCIDSRASQHITSYKEYFITYFNLSKGCKVFLEDDCH
eukprot:Gb_36202 [translate_table: standard]